MFNRSRAMLPMLAAIAFAGAISPALHTQPPRLEASVSSKRKRGLFNGAVLPSSSTLAGGSSLFVSVAQGKRIAAKRRNQRRHKRHLRG